jgi:hypothetical protein
MISFSPRFLFPSLIFTRKMWLDNCGSWCVNRTQLTDLNKLFFAKPHVQFRQMTRHFMVPATKVKVELTNLKFPQPRDAHTHDWCQVWELSASKFFSSFPLHFKFCSCSRYFRRGLIAQKRFNVNYKY